MVSVPEKSVFLVLGHSLFTHQFPQKVIKHLIYFISPIILCSRDHTQLPF